VVKSDGLSKAAPSGSQTDGLQHQPGRALGSSSAAEDSTAASFRSQTEKAAEGNTMHSPRKLKWSDWS